MGSLPDVQPERLHASRSRSRRYNAAQQPAPATTRCSTARSRAPGRRARRSSRSPRPPRSRAALWSVDDTFDDTGQFCFAGRPCRHNAGGAANGVLNLVNAIRVSDDVFFYNLGALTERRSVTHPNGGALQQWARAVRDRPARPGSTCPARRRERCPTPRWRAQRNQLEAECDAATGRSVHQRPHERAKHGLYRSRSIARRLRDRRRHEPAVVDRRQRQPGGRPGRRPGHAAAARGRLLGDRQRRHDRHPAPRARHPERRRHRAAEDRPAAGAPPQHQPALPRRRSARACTRPPQSAGRHLDRRDGQLPRAGLRQDRHRAVHTDDGETDYAWYACFVPATATSKPIVVVCGSSRAASAPSPPRRSPARSSRSGSSASPGRSSAGNSNTL